MSFFSKVSVCSDPTKYNAIAADFICNRYDLINKTNYLLLRHNHKKEDYYVQVSFDGSKAELGIWLAPITKGILDDVSRYIFRHYKEIKTVEYGFGLIPCGKASSVNHFRIELPDNVNALTSRMTQKSRYNLRRSKRLLSEECGEIIFEEYKACDVPIEIVETFLRLKEESHGFVFKGSPYDYIRSHGISDIYVMRNSQKLLSVLLSCEQCRIVYLENLSYDAEFAHFSPGQILYQYYLERLIEKGRDSLFLMGGNYEYKRRYGAIEDTVWFCVIYKGFRANWDNIYKKKLRKRYKQLRHTVKLFFTGKKK